MDTVLVKEYVRGHIRCNVFEKIIFDVIPSSSEEGYSLAGKRSKNFFKSYRREFRHGKYRFDSYSLDEIGTKLIRSLYGPVSLIVYNHFFQHQQEGSLRNFMNSVKPYKVERFDSPGVIFYLEFRKTQSAYLANRTTIFLNV